MEQKICCGGFYLGEGLELDDRTLKATGGSSPVPDPEVADIGKVLGIVEEGAGAKYAPVEGSGSGLPDPSTLSNGTAMVVVNGEWKMQEGYGYTEEVSITTITWDGDTEGREALMPDFPFYKVSDNGIPVSLLIGATIIFDGNETIVTQDMISEMIDGGVVMVGETVISVVDAVEMGGITLNKGIYFTKTGQGKYVSSLTYGGDAIHKIDQKYLPNSRTMVKVDQNNTYDEILEILNSSLMPYRELPGGWRNAWLYVSRIGDGKIYFGSPAIATPFGTENFSTYVDNDGWGDIVGSDSVNFSNEPYYDGTYTLTCTRTNGENVFSWELTT